MKRLIVLWTLFSLTGLWIGSAAAKDLEVLGKRLVSQRPPFEMNLPAGFRLIHSFVQDNPKESSQTRVFLLVKARDKEAEEMLVLQISDRTNPQAGPITAPPLKPYTEKRMYLMEKVKRQEVPADLMVQLMAWNPDAPSLEPVIKKGIAIPSRWALQGQCLFVLPPDHAVLFRYSKDARSLGVKVSEEGDAWNRDTLTGNEKKACEAFKKMFMEMVESISIKNL